MESQEFKVYSLTILIILLSSIGASFQPKITEVSNNLGKSWELNVSEEDERASLEYNQKINLSEDVEIEHCVNSVKKSTGDRLQLKFSSPTTTTPWLRSSDNCRTWNLNEDDYNQELHFAIEVRNQDEEYFYSHDSDFRVTLEYTNITRQQTEEEIITQNLTELEDNREEISSFSDLTHFPRPFTGYDTQAKPKVVVGEDAQTVDAVSALDITAEISLTETATDRDMRKALTNNRLNTNMVIVGGPVVNDITYRLVSENKSTARENYTEGTAFIEYINNPLGYNQHAVLAAGETGADTRAATNFLLNYEENHAQLQNAQKIVIDTETREVIEKYPS